MAHWEPQGFRHRPTAVDNLQRILKGALIHLALRMNFVSLELVIVFVFIHGAMFFRAREGCTAVGTGEERFILRIMHDAHIIGGAHADRASGFVVENIAMDG